MEPTYYWDALDTTSREWLASNTQPGRTIEFATFPHSWLYLRSIGQLPARLVPFDRGQPNWYVLQNRPGAFSDADRALASHGHARLHGNQAGSTIGMDLSIQRVHTTEHASPQQYPEHSDRTLKRHAPRPTGLFGLMQSRPCWMLKPPDSVLSRGLGGCDRIAYGGRVVDWGGCAVDGRCASYGRGGLLVAKRRQLEAKAAMPGFRSAMSCCRQVPALAPRTRRVHARIS